MFMRAVHPAEVLKGELEELVITPTELARQIEVPPNRVSQIIAGKRSVTGDTALRFGHWFGVDPQFWLNLQAQYDLVQADRETGAQIRHLPTRAGVVLNLVRPTTCRSAASTVPAQCARGACPETRCHVCVPRYALRWPNESRAKPVDRRRPRSCPTALTDRQTSESSLL